MFSTILSLGLLVLGCYGQKETGPVGKVEVQYFQKCDNFGTKDGFDFSAALRNINDGENKAFDFHINLGEEINEDFKFNISVDKYKNGVWQNDVYQADGALLEYINQYIGTVYTNFRGKIQPNIEADNVVPVGEYTLDGYEDVAESIDLPQILYGLFRVKFFILKNDDQDVVCVEFGANSEPKD